MQLFLIRHAAAVPRRPRLDDADRPLTPKGRRRWHRAVRGLERLGLSFDRLYHSPWLRAVETADALIGVLEGESVVTHELAHSPTPMLLERLEGERVALVGHQPWLGELVSLLLFGHTRHAERFSLKKGAVAWLQGEPRPGGMTLRALLPLDVPSALGR